MKLSLSVVCLMISRETGAFVTSPSSRSISTKLNGERPPQFDAPKSGNGNILESIFTGGAFEEEPADEIMSSAASIARSIKSTADLGWTGPPRRKGNARPRHRAWGGEGEQAVQDKANYDEERENCVEKWLTYEDFLAATRASEGAAADTVFVALAGGAKYAERDVCEAKIAEWTGGDVSTSTTTSGGIFGRRSVAKSTIDEQAFIKTVKQGRQDLLTGWASFLGVNTFFASCILFPTNPAAKALEGLVDSVKDQAGVLPPPI